MMATREYNTRSYASRHYTRRIALGEQIEDRAKWYAAGILTWPVVQYVVWPIAHAWMSTH